MENNNTFQIIITTEQIQQDFRSVRSTLKFVGLAFLSGGFYPFHWIMRMLEVLNDKYDVSKETTKTSLYLIWASLVCTYLLTPLAEGLQLDSFVQDDFWGFWIFTNIIYILAAFSWFFTILFSLKTKKIVQNVLIEKNIQRKMSTLWAVVFNYFYFYYVLNNLDTNNK